jgi:hypothetical protein
VKVIWSVAILMPIAVNFFIIRQIIPNAVLLKALIRIDYDVAMEVRV